MRILASVCFLVVMAGFVMTACGILLLLVQLASWIQAGTWPNIGLRALIGEPLPHPIWLGLQPLLYWLFQLPLSLALGFGTLIGSTAAALANRLNREQPSRFHGGAARTGLC